MKTEVIEMIKTPLAVVRVAVFCLPLALVASCGSGDYGPNGGTITSSPAGYAISVPYDAVGGAGASGPLPFTVALKTASGAPVINTAVYVTAPQDTAVATQIWVTNISTGVTTGPTIITGPYAVYTDVSGAIQIQISIPLFQGYDYGDTLAFASGNLRVNDTITVTCAPGTAGACP